MRETGSTNSQVANQTRELTVAHLREASQCNIQVATSEKRNVVCTTFLGQNTCQHVLCIDPRLTASFEEHKFAGAVIKGVSQAYAKASLLVFHSNSSVCVGVADPVEAKNIYEAFYPIIWKARETPKNCAAEKVLLEKYIEKLTPDELAHYNKRKRRPRRDMAGQ